MSLLLKTIRAFPRGKFSEELIAELDKDCDPNKRISLFSELYELQSQDLIFKARGGKWKGKFFPRSEFQDIGDTNSGDILNAVLGRFEPLSAPEILVDDQEKTKEFNLKSLISYFKSSVRSDARGALAAIPEYHETKWLMISGHFPDTFGDGDSSIIELTIPIEQLPGSFRKALLRREEEDKSITLGWPISSGVNKSAPKIWPVGLFSGEYRHENNELKIKFDSNNVFVNPLWASENHREIGWQKTQLNRLFNIGAATPLSFDEFTYKLREAAAGHYKGPLSGRNLISQINFSMSEVWDSFGVFLNDDNTFNKGVIDDFKLLETFDMHKFENTAVKDFVFGAKTLDKLTAAINIGDTNQEQLAAVQNALNHSISVVTGPPGTGKSQTIVSAVATTLLNGGSVLFASKNHQALDAVMERLSNLAADVNFVVRTYDKNGDIDASFKKVLSEIANENLNTPDDFDLHLKSKLTTLSKNRLDALKEKQAREEIECEIADILFRLRFRKLGEKKLGSSAVLTLKRKSYLARLFYFLQTLVRRKEEMSLAEQSAKTGASLAVLENRLRQLRDLKGELNNVDDPIALTKNIEELAKHILPNILRQQTKLSENEVRSLLEDNDYHSLVEGTAILPENIAKTITKARPLWVTSVQAASKRIPLIEGLFDLLVLDEATQCDVASAIPILFRAKKAMFLGDAQQLKFIPNIGKAQDLNLMRLHGLDAKKTVRFSQSILPLFDASLRVPNVQKTLLRSQYRSAPDIVEYISDQFYGGALTAAVDFEKLKCPKDCKPGITWSDVKPYLEIRNDHVNRAEIDAIVLHLEKLLVDQKYQGTVGFVSPFRGQVFEFEKCFANSIASETLAKAKLNYGTVDSFQGDERDLILFSPTLSANSTASALNFVQKDFRRLNVAISRAKAVAHVFGDLSFARSNKVRSLGKLADFATRGSRRVAGETTFDSEWERQLYHAVKNKGLDPIPQYEIAGRRLDFALFGKGDMKLDVEVDGRRWHTDIDGKRKVSDIWRDHQLQSMGWKVLRFWVDELDKDMERCVGLIEQELA
jgi:very-short-patch-repair endonuclease